MKTENNVVVPSNSISLRTKLKGKKNVVNIDHFHPKVCTNHKMMKAENRND